LVEMANYFFDNLFNIKEYIIVKKYFEEKNNRLTYLVTNLDSITLYKKNSNKFGGAVMLF